MIHMATANSKKVTKDLTTCIGTLSFPHVFKSTAVPKDDGTLSYDIQIIIPKTERDGLRAILAAIKEVGEAKWGANWKKVRTPLRDGDKEADEITDDGMTKGEKYPERLGCYFLNARSTKPVGVYGRDRSPLTEESDLYGGCKGRISVTFYPYSQQGNNGIGCGLNGVQKVADGEPFGNARPSVEAMFDMLDDEDDLDLDGDEDFDEEPEKPAKKSGKAKSKRKSQKAAAEDDEYDDLDDDI